jgi:hypothetical protein
MASATRPNSCPTTYWRCGSETKRERQAESAQATQKWRVLHWPSQSVPRHPDPRIRTIVRSLIQEATSAVRPKMIAGRAWRPTWPSIDPRTQRCRSQSEPANVATSRAQCLCVLVASPMVFEADCRTPEQMRLANAYSRYLELAQQPTLLSPSDSAGPDAFRDAA